MPELSVIIPTFNRSALLGRCLEALCCQTQPFEDFEVVVVVDGSTDDTMSALKTMVTPYTILTRWQSNRGQAVALNEGIEIATGRYCLFLDDDIVSEPQLVAEHLRIQRERGGVVGLGHLPRMLPRDADGFARYLQAWGLQHHKHLANGARAPNFMDCFSGNMSAPRAAIQQVGGFATDLPRSYDVELGYRLALAGFKFVYLPSATGHQDYQKGFYEIAADTYYAGKAGVELYRRYPAMVPYMEIGKFGTVSRAARLLRVALLELGGPIRPLAIVSRLFEHTSLEQMWYRFLYSYCYWRGVKHAIPDHEEWRRMTLTRLLQPGS